MYAAPVAEALEDLRSSGSRPDVEKSWHSNWSECADWRYMTLGNGKKRVNRWGESRENFGISTSFYAGDRCDGLVCRYSNGRRTVPPLSQSVNAASWPSGTTLRCLDIWRRWRRRRPMNWTVTQCWCWQRRMLLYQIGWWRTDDVRNGRI